MFATALRTTLLLCGSLLGIAFAAEGPFIGEWIEVVSTAVENPNPITYEVNGATVTVMSSLSVKPTEWLMDGVKRPIPGNEKAIFMMKPDGRGGFTRIAERDGKVISEDSRSLSADGNTLVSTYIFHTPDGLQTEKTTYRRTSGSSGLAGTWMPISRESTPTKIRVTEEAGVLVVSYDSGQKLMVDGQSRRTTFGSGRFSDLAATKVSTHRIEKKGVMDGRSPTHGTLEVSADGKTMTTTDHFTAQSGKTTTTKKVFARRQ